MAKTNHSNNTQGKEVVEDLTATENFLDRNKKTLIGIVAGVVVVILGYVGYQKFVAEPNDIASHEELWKAYYDFENDSLTLAAQGTDNYQGLEALASEYDGTSGGDIANYAMGIISMENGEFDVALDYFSSCRFDDVMVGSLCLGLQGDCNVELGNYDKAVSFFEKALSREVNDYTTPMFLMKSGIVYEALDQKNKAFQNYTRIKKEFNKSEYASDIDKYIGRTKS